MRLHDVTGASVGRRSFLKTAGAAGAVGLAGCLGAQSGDGGSGPTHELVFAGPESGTTAPVLKTIKEQGIDEDNDLDLQIRWMGVPAAEQNFLNGNTEIGFLGPIPAATQINQGSTVRNIFPDMRSPNFCIVREEAGVSSFEDLVGKTIGSPPAFFFNYQAFEFFTNLEGFSMDDFEMKPGDPGAQVGFAHQGEFDAMIHWDPYVTRIMEGGSGSWEILFNYAGKWEELVGNPMALTEYSVHKTVLDNQTEAVKAWADTMFQAAEVINDNTVEIIDTYSENLGLESRAQVEMYANRVSGSWYESFDEPTREGHVSLVQQAHEFGVIEDEPPIDTQFVDIRDV